MNRPLLWIRLATVNCDTWRPFALHLPNNIILGLIEISFYFQYNIKIISSCYFSCTTTCNLSYRCETLWVIPILPLHLSHYTYSPLYQSFLVLQLFFIYCTCNHLLVEVNFFNTAFHWLFCIWSHATCWCW